MASPMYKPGKIFSVMLCLITNNLNETTENDQEVDSLSTCSHDLLSKDQYVCVCMYAREIIRTLTKRA